MARRDEAIEILAKAATAAAESAAAAASAAVAIATGSRPPHHHHRQQQPHAHLQSGSVAPATPLGSDGAVGFSTPRAGAAAVGTANEDATPSTVTSQLTPESPLPARADERAPSTIGGGMRGDGGAHAGGARGGGHGDADGDAHDGEEDIHSEVPEEIEPNSSGGTHSYISDFHSDSEVVEESLASPSSSDSSTVVKALAVDVPPPDSVEALRAIERKQAKLRDTREKQLRLEALLATQAAEAKRLAQEVLEADRRG